MMAAATLWAAYGLCAGVGAWAGAWAMRRRAWNFAQGALREAAQEAEARERALLVRLQAGRSQKDRLLEAARTTASLAGTAKSSQTDIEQLRGARVKLHDQVGELAERLSKAGRAADEMVFGSSEVAKSLAELSLTCEQTATAMQAIDASVSRVQSSAHETNRLSSDVHRDAETGTTALAQTLAGIEQIRRGNLEAAQVISELGQQILAVGKILSVIDDVAEQTNLLALNAAIIAAQAGEQGRGFAVVADEIKALAERTGASTKEIAQIILTIEAQGRRATSSMDEGVKNVHEGVRLGNNARDALSKIVQSAGRSTVQAEGIASATLAQAEGAKQVSDAIGRIAQTVAQVAYATAEQAGSSRHIQVSTQEASRIVADVQAGNVAAGHSNAPWVSLLVGLPEQLAPLGALLTAEAEAHERLAADAEVALLRASEHS